MKKALLLNIFLILTTASFAYDLPNRNLFIDGTAERQDHLDFFLRVFRDEAIGTGYPLADNIEEAGFIFKFDVTSNFYTDSAGLLQRILPDNNLYIITINFRKAEDDYDLLIFSYLFTELEDMYRHTQFLFMEAARYIPQLSEEDLIIVMEDVPEINKWIYLRASFDYPIRFYSLQPKGLFGGAALYAGDISDPERVSPLDNKIIVLPGITLGAEFNLHKFFSTEINFQVFMGDPNDNMFLNMALGAELRFPILNTRNFILAPYAAFAYNITASDVFKDYPPFAAGGGLHLALKRGRYGYFFFDAKFMLSFSDAIMKNPYHFLEEEERAVFYPNPHEIHYQRFFLGLSIGYKFGLLDKS